MKTALMNVSIYKIAEYSLLPLMLINLTVAANNWNVLGFGPEQFIYAITIGLAWYVGYFSRYWRIVTLMIVFSILMRILEAFGGGESLKQMSFTTLAVVFAVAGAKIYGRNAFLLHKQLVIFLAFCIPIMLIQILGVSSFFYGWVTDNLHDPTMMTLDDIGTFIEIPLYPMLFVGIDELQYSIGQARPAGLFYANNILSIFVSIAVGMNLAIPRTSRISFSDIVVTLAIVLSMSKLAYGIPIILYLWFIIFGVLKRRLLALKLISILAIVTYLYYILFPGLFLSAFSEDMVMHAFMLRIVDLIRSLGLENSFGWLIEISKAYESNNEVIGEGYSTFATLLRNKLLVPQLFIIMIGSILYLYRVRNMISCQAMIYVTTLFVCVLTQFAVPFLNTASFQLIIGFALFPLFKGMRQSNVLYRIYEKEAVSVSEKATGIN